ncbi:MAG TPA: cytochrome D1 domain-containing protein [Xanthobacteraceae bacterium]|nr:cytochrome D1 domain-containing protein [Xanthobacteraceae bacterium]
MIVMRTLSKGAASGIASFLAMATLLAPTPPGFATQDEASSAITSNGVTVEFAARAIGPGQDGNKIVAGQDVELRFKLTDAVGATAISNARAAIWIDARKKTGFMMQKPGDADGACREKIAAFLQGGLSYRPDVDLNSWYILALNSKASISVIDPLRGYGGQRIVTLIGLNSPGEDWVMGRDGRSLFVALAASDEVAVIDTATWKVATNIQVGRNPVRLALQSDGRYLWVGHDGGVAVIDAERRAVVQDVTTGAGRHDIALGNGDLAAFVSNPAEGTVSLIDVATLKIVATVAVGGNPGAIAYSPLANMAYVADAKNGVISAIDTARREVVAKMQAKPGLYALRFTADGRWGFSANPLANEVVVLDASTNRIANRIDIDGAPDQVSFGAKFAFVRATESSDVSLIALDTLGKQEPAVVKAIASGQQAPLADSSSLPATAPVIVPTPDEGMVLVANPSDKAIYFYAEGMNAPIGTFNNMGREMRAVLALDRSLRETAPGVYTGYLRLPGDGDYDVAFHMSSPPVTHCFTVSAAPDPALARSAKPYRLEFLAEDRNFAAGDTARVQFRLVDPRTDTPISDVTDLEVQTFLVPGTWRVLRPARSLGNGIYEMAIELPQPGVYYLHVASRSLRARYNDMPSLVLRARESREKG